MPLLLVNLLRIWRTPYRRVARPGAMTVVLAGTAALLGTLATGGAGAQVDLPPMPASTTTTAPGATTTTTTGVLAGALKEPVPAPVPAPPPAPGKHQPAPPPPPVAVPGDGAGEGVAPPPGAGPFPADLAAMMRSVRRTGPRNTNALVDALKQLTDLGVPLDEAVRVGMGRFPVAGRATYSHDWWFPRFGPGWRLHQGTDVFGARGTPLRSPTSGVVRFGSGGLGGLSTYVVQGDGTYFYMAHLQGHPPGLKDGQAVNTGDIVGYLGSSGNAQGGSPHLHFEVHPAVRTVTVGKGKRATTKVVHHPVRPGTVLPAMDPKPLLDLYLHEAMQQLPAIVESYRAKLPAPPPPDPSLQAVAALAVGLPGQQVGAGAELASVEPPLARVPLLALACLLVVLVASLTPVLRPRRRLVPAVAAGAGPSRGTRRKRSRASAPPSHTPPPDATAPPGDPPPPSPAENGKGRGRARGKEREKARGRRRSGPDTARPAPEYA